MSPPEPSKLSILSLEKCNAAEAQEENFKMVNMNMFKDE